MASTALNRRRPSASLALALSVTCAMHGVGVSETRIRRVILSSHAEYVGAKHIGAGQILSLSGVVA